MTDPIVLPEKLDTVAAPMLKTLLESRDPSDVVIDGTAVKGCGTLCAQVLLAVHRDLSERDGTLTLRTSQAMADDLRLLGLDTELKIQGDDT